MFGRVRTFNVDSRVRGNDVSVEEPIPAITAHA